ncbi:MAG: SGNH hydrolase domain-containing protein, partial [Specibacter sp.]
LYLFHWPLLVFFLMVSGRDHAGPKAGFAIIVISVVAALLATKYIDAPLRSNPWIAGNRIRGALVIGVCLALVAVPLGAWQGHVKAQTAAAGKQVPTDNPGALSVMPGYVDKVSEGAAVLPALDGIINDWPQYAGSCEGDAVPEFEELAKFCTQDGVLDGTASATVVVVGNSHADHMSGAVRSLAVKNHWRVVKILGLGCVYGADTAIQEPRCKTFNEQATAYVMALKPQKVFTIATRTTESTPKEALVPGYAQTVKTFTDAGIGVVGVRDNPRFKVNMPWCVSKNGDESPQCRVPLETVMPAVSPLKGFAAGNKKFFPVDMTDLLCPRGVCQAVIGNVHVYIDTNHVSQTYWNTMAVEFGRRLTTQKGW